MPCLLCISQHTHTTHTNRRGVKMSGTAAPPNARLDRHNSAGKNAVGEKSMKRQAQVPRGRALARRFGGRSGPRPAPAFPRRHQCSASRSVHSSVIFPGVHNALCLPNNHITAHHHH